MLFYAKKWRKKDSSFGRIYSDGAAGGNFNNVASYVDNAAGTIEGKGAGTAGRLSAQFKPANARLANVRRRKR